MASRKVYKSEFLQSPVLRCIGGQAFKREGSQRKPEWRPPPCSCINAEFARVGAGGGGGRSMKTHAALTFTDSAVASHQLSCQQEAWTHGLVDLGVENQPCVSCVIFGWSLNFSVPGFSHLKVDITVGAT